MRMSEEFFRTQKKGHNRWPKKDKNKRHHTCCINGSIDTSQQRASVIQMRASGLVWGFKPVAGENQSGSIPPSGLGSWLC
ncbi:hypothetical protein CEXT_354381 [Caerostris extrusa]|uniref:Uncharacterized protein n=1 Tax=Caerostris extrusa TaxID=172846 RepID=A0AAV4Y412_CAEEX|nr:hypothetical protein CEXT_354381 [Caerostris extrusa]